MELQETRAVLSVALLAAFCDGQKHEREREQVRRIAEGLSADAAIGLPMLVQDVLMKRVTLATAVPALRSVEARSLAYEMAVCVCDADGAQSVPEQGFLQELKRALALDEGQAGGFAQQADAWAQAGSVPAGAAAATMGAGSGAATGVGAGVGAGVVAGVGAGALATVDSAALDQQILSAAILNGALELLPETLSTMAIIPLQMRLVYQIGKAHGYELDSGHIKDFVATAGVGLTSQYLEQAGRKLLTGVLQRVSGRSGGLLGSVIGGVGRQAVSSGMSFVSTYALGHLAKRYYAGGRSFSAALLKSTYQDIAQQAQGLYQRHLPAIQERARTLDTQQVLAMVRGER
jgi:uncharacterized protein (DUF697 family)/tellurite resistance protein